MVSVRFLPKTSFCLQVLSSAASVGLCVHVCVNHEFVRTINQSSFKLRSPNLDQRCKTPWFINLGKPIFPLNHSCDAAATVFTIPTTFGITHARCYTRAEGYTQSATRVRSSLLGSLTVPSTHYVLKIVFTFSPICRACTNSVAISNHHEGLYFSLHQPAPVIRHFFCLVVIAGDGRQQNQPRDCAMTWAFIVLQKMCLVKIS